MLILMFLLLIAGFVILVKGADIFVEGSAALARRFHVPGVLIGLTIVAMGTSAPELAVSTSAAIQGANEIALSNVIGSNIFNLLCVLGVCAIIHTLPVDDEILKRDFPVSIIATVFLLLTVAGRSFISGRYSSMGMSEPAGTVSRLISGILFLGFIIYIGYLIIRSKKHPAKEEQALSDDAAKEKKELPIWKCALFIVLGIGMIVGGGQAVVYSARAIALAAGMTETLVGLTIVAVGTSLPELVTSIVAARKKETGLAVGNAVGSCIFNLMLILGISSLIHPVEANLASICDLVILLAISVLTWVFAGTKKQISRWEGIVLVCIYIADVIFAILR
ncbi:MAG: calcium/sodium antiporter [Lachnospiraceae bacterium]|nr:calcium/sodium antiporter [Lachnospiraceae bacterium]